MNNHEMVDMSFILFVSLCDCSKAAMVPKFEASLIA